MSHENGLNFNAQISEEAAYWVVEFRTGEIDDTGRRQFDAWMRSSPEHLRAFLEIAAIWNEGSGLDAAHELDVETLRLRARAADNVVPIDMPATQCLGERAPSCLAPAPPLVPVRLGFFYRRLAVAASIALTVVGLLWWDSLRATTYSTAVGEQRTLTLPDGSTAMLDSRSALRLRFRAKERDIDLLEGQALFHVAKDPTRPFVVASNGTRVRAVGTQFDVYRKPEGTVVTVVEGRVAVSTTAIESAGGAVRPSRPRGGVPSDAQTSQLEIPGAELLSAGEQATLIAQVAPKPVQTNVAAATAWTQHQLVLDSARLIDVAAEFNRYSTRKVVVEDSSADPLLLSGVFSTDPDFLIRYLRARSDVTVQESNSEVHIVRKK